MSEPLLIGACLHDHRQFAVARRTVDAAMFANHAHRTIWAAMCALADEGVTPDPPTVNERLMEQGLLGDAGGNTAVLELASAAGVSANVPHYAGKVVRDHRARQLSAAMRQGLADLESADPDEVLASVTAAVGHASGVGQWRPSELADRLFALLEGRAGQVWSTGWLTVDEIWKPAPGTLTIVTGVPGSGKSTLLDSALLYQVGHGRKVAVWSPEQAPAEEHEAQLLHTWHGRNPRDMDPAEVRHTLGTWDGTLTILDPDDTSLQSVVARAAGLSATDGLDVLLIDPWNTLDHRMGDKRQDLYLQEQIGKVFRFARATGVAVWIVAHPAKMQRMPGTETCWTPPTLYDISGGAEWANKADHVVTVWRDAAGERTPPHVVQVIVSKVRRAWWGKVGRKTLRFDPVTRTYAEQPIAQEPAA